jgi:hypothetical protein
MPSKKYCTLLNSTGKVEKSKPRLANLGFFVGFGKKNPGFIKSGIFTQAI